MFITNICFFMIEITGKALKEKRLRLKWRQIDSADFIGVSTNTIQNYEQGKNIPKSKYPILLKFLEIPEDDEDGEPENSSNDKVEGTIEQKFARINDDEIGIYCIKHHDRLYRNSELYRKHIKALLNEHINNYLEELMIKRGLK